MCILFIYNGTNDNDSDYSLILVANRDEFFERPSLPMGPWTKDSNVYGARGKIVADYVKSDNNTNEYVTYMISYAKECNDFVFVSVEFGNSTPVVKSYSNATHAVDQWTETCLGFSNSLPNNPLKKAEVGKNYLRSIVSSKYNKVSLKPQLIDELIKLLKSTKRHLPDPQLETRQPNIYKELSSIFVNIPKAKYGTRAHTIVLITKSGHVDLIEISMQSPISPETPQWERKEFKFDISTNKLSKS